MKIERLIVSDAVSNRVSFGRGNPKNYLTIHQTGNTSERANAMAHHNLQARGGVGYGWHWQVDDEMAIQTHDHSFKIWHAGDGRGKGNTESISIEICVNSDGNYKKSVENGAKLAAMILKEENIDISRMVQHNYWSGKDCPHEIRYGKDGITWTDFVNKVKNYLEGDEEVKEEYMERIQERYMINGNYSIDSLPWWCDDKKNVGTTADYQGYVVTVSRKWGNYWYSQFLGGWIDHRAFEEVETISEEKTVKNKGYSVDTKPWGTKGFETVGKSDELIGKDFKITARKGAYLYIHSIAKWVDEKAFE
ncbi:N-acetylmuramoyl-L-alanine amidase [uncultured Parvimonas sp.]|uniref:N-acetylmuramoyl-L-alanine amidase n=1 Tax=uncultured Parvimonas sp. TaxID=747372 RepID=UPI0028D7187E|nr:N-acetylmuramoyl-L-alanine amidase [uncultured Parvimonas sp.]